MEILELENTITKIKSSVNGLKSRMERAKKRISELKNGIEISQSEQGEKKEIKMIEQCLQDL